MTTPVTDQVGSPRVDVDVDVNINATMDVVVDDDRHDAHEAILVTSTSRSKVAFAFRFRFMSTSNALARQIADSVSPTGALERHHGLEYGRPASLGMIPSTFDRSRSAGTR